MAPLQDAVQGRLQIKRAPAQEVNNHGPFGEYRPVGYEQQDRDWARSSAVRAAAPPVWGEGSREEGQRRGQNPSLRPLSSGAVVEPRGRQLYQHDLGLRGVPLTQRPLDRHQGPRCTSSKHGVKQQTLNNYRPGGDGKGRGGARGGLFGVVHNLPGRADLHMWSYRTLRQQIMKNLNVHCRAKVCPCPLLRSKGLLKG